MSFSASKARSTGIVRAFNRLNRRFSAAWKPIDSSVFVLIVVASVAAVDMPVLVVLELVSDGRHLRVAKAVLGSDRAVLEVSLAVGADEAEAILLSARARAASFESELLFAIGIPIGLDFSNAEGLFVVADLNGKTFWIV